MVASPTTTAVAQAATTLLTLIARQSVEGESGPDSAAADGNDAAEEDACASGNATDKWGLRIGAIFVILVTSLLGTVTPIVLRRATVVPRSVWEFAKFFGSGVIIATAYIHLLAPAWDELTSDCLVAANPVFGEYDWAPAISMMAVYAIFLAEIVAYRVGTNYMAKITGNANTYGAHGGDTNAASHTHTHAEPGSEAVPTDAHAHDHAHDHARAPSQSSGPESPVIDKERQLDSTSDLNSTGAGDALVGNHEAAKQLIGVAVLEFGVVLHSIIIGLTLAVNDNFVILFVVIIFHQMFEGLGLGSRLALLQLPKGYAWTRYAAAALYCICTPIGMAAGLGAINSVNTNAATASAVTGVLDAISSGILMYTGLVELIAHEILFNPRFMRASAPRITYCLGCMVLGSGIMALLGRWA